MRIALFSTNFYPTPPSGEKIIYAPLWITHYLSEGLVKKGHKVFLFASSDSKTSATLISNSLPSLRRNKNWFLVYKKLVEKEKEIIQGKYELSWAVTWKEILRENYEFLLAVKLYEMAQKKMFDIIQFHSRPNVLPLSFLLKTPIVFTFHNHFNFPLGTNSLKLIYSSFKKEKSKNIHFITLSKAQRKTLPNLNYAATIPNGVDVQKFSFSEKRGDYLAFAGRILPWKGIETAIQVAKKTGKKLKIAGPIPPDYLDFWKRKIKPSLSRNITYEGMLNQNQMVSFYQGAQAFLMPILYDEAFGLVMIEAMASGTPVIAFRKNPVPEIVKDGKTGFIVKNTKEMTEAIRKINQIDRRECRKHVERNFTIEKMVDNYEKIYQKILNKQKI